MRFTRRKMKISSFHECARVACWEVQHFFFQRISNDLIGRKCLIKFHKFISASPPSIPPTFIVVGNLTKEKLKFVRFRVEKFHPSSKRWRWSSILFFTIWKILIGENFMFWSLIFRYRYSFGQWTWNFRWWITKWRKTCTTNKLKFIRRNSTFGVFGLLPEKNLLQLQLKYSAQPAFTSTILKMYDI